MPPKRKISFYCYIEGQYFVSKNKDKPYSADIWLRSKIFSAIFIDYDNFVDRF